MDEKTVTGLTLKEAADRLSISRSTVRRLIDEGDLDGFPIGAGGEFPHIRVTPESVAAYIERQKNKKLKPLKKSDT